MNAERLDWPPLRNLRDRAEVWWNERTSREHLLLAALMVCILVSVLVVTVIAPLRAVRSEALNEIRSAEMLEARLRAAGPGGLARLRRGDSQTIVRETLRQAGIIAQSVSLEENGIRVIVADVPFNQFAGWIAELEQTSRLKVISAKIDRVRSPGHVMAAVLVRG